tara:strand:+ start:2307 stop:3206 length:900 start_codon:yes stop_codon:yes gene_type:complete
MKNSKTKIILVGIGLSVFGFIFQSQIIDLFKGDIEGCMDPLASNYNEEATIADDSCTFEKPLSADLFNKIEILKNSDWDVDEYTNLRDEILIYFTSIQQSNSGQEKISLNKLDMAYMVVLEIATDKAILNCFTSISKLKKEVQKFYNIFKNKNTAIKAAQYGFNSHSEFYGYKTKVNKLLEKRFVQTDFDALKEKINKFSNSKSFLQFKECKKLTNIISDGISRLDKYETIDKKYNKFEKDYKTTFFSAKDFVSKRYFNIFKDYKWYYNKVIETDKRVKKEKKERDERRREKEKLEREV